MSFRFASTWWFAHSLRSTRSACSTGAWWVVITCCWLDGAIAFVVWFVVGLWNGASVRFTFLPLFLFPTPSLPVICKLLLYHFARISHHHCRIVEGDCLVTSIAILRLVDVLLLDNHRRSRSYYVRWRRRLLLLIFFLQLCWIEFPLFWMEPRRLNIVCRLLDHFPIGDWRWDREVALCIYRQSCRSDDDGNRLRCTCNGLGHDKKLMLMVVDGANAADYRCWNLLEIIARTNETRLFNFNVRCNLNFNNCEKGETIHISQSTILMHPTES